MKVLFTVLIMIGSAAGLALGLVLYQGAYDLLGGTVGPLYYAGIVLFALLAVVVFCALLVGNRDENVKTIWTEPEKRNAKQ